MTDIVERLRTDASMLRRIMLDETAANADQAAAEITELRRQLAEADARVAHILHSYQHFAGPNVKMNMDPGTAAALARHASRTSTKEG